jgi:hypothetical protein
MTKTIATAVTPSPISRIVVKFESSESRVCETTTVMLATMGLALYHPELLLYCQFAVATRLWFPVDEVDGMRTEVSMCLFILAVRLSGNPEVT